MSDAVATPTPTSEAAPAAPETNSSSESVESINPEAIGENAPFASDEELNAAWEAEINREEDSEEASHEEDTDQSADEDYNATDTSADENQESVDDGKSESPDVKRLREELLKKNRQIEDSQKFISRINQRYGDLKKQIVEQIAGIQKGIEDMSQAEQIEAGLQLKDLKTSLQSITNEEALFNHTVKTKEAVERAIPEDEWNLDLMVEEMEAEGGDPEYIARFKQNPFAAAHPHEIIMLHKATRAKFGMRVLATALKNAQKEVAELRGKLKTRPSEIVKKIDSVSKNSVGVTAKSGGGGAKRTVRDLSDAEISRLSEKELNEALQMALQSEQGE